MPGQPMAPSLAESWTVSRDGLTYEFVLRKGVKLHNGDPLGAEDVKFSFERYKGVAAPTLKAHVATVEMVDAHRVRFRLKKPWADFMTFYATPATGAAWILPKRYVERLGDDGFKKAPVGVCAWPPTWRSTGRPSTRRSISASAKSARASFLRISTSPGSHRRTRTIRLAPGNSWRRPATPGASTPAKSSATWCTCRSPRPSPTSCRRWGSARSFGAWSGRASRRATRKKKLKPLARVGSAASGNAATRIEAFVLSTGARAYGGFPDIDGLYQEQASELDPKRRAAILHKIQQLMHERVVFAPLLEPALLNGYGPRVANSGLGLIVGHLYSAPYEDLQLKGK